METKAGYDAQMTEARRRRKALEMERRRRHRRKVMGFLAVAVSLAAVTALVTSVTTARAGYPEDVPEDAPGGELDLPSGGAPVDGTALPSGGGEGGNIPPEIPDWIDQDLLPVNEYSRPGTPLTEVKGVVVHYVGNPGTTAWQNKNYFAGLAESHDTYASSNLIVGLDGEVILCVPLDEVAYCSTVRNKDTISIEVCHPDETGKFSDTTMDALVRVLRWLCVSYGLEREDILRHYDADGKVCPTWYVNNPDDWEALRDKVFEDLSAY